MVKDKIVCIECGFKGYTRELLKGVNPFNESQGIYGCPDCYSIDSERVACDEDKCWNEATCGTPTKDGYRNTCGKHMPKGE